MDNKKKLEDSNPASEEKTHTPPDKKSEVILDLANEDVLGLANTFTDFFSFLAEQPSRFVNIQRSILEGLWFEKGSDSSEGGGLSKVPK